MNESVECSSCSNESYKVIPLTRIFDKLDDLFSRNDLLAVGKLLDYWESEALKIGDLRGLLEILNEKIGYYRRTLEKDKAMAAIGDAFDLIENKKIGDSVSIATIYLNGATTLKAFGAADKAMPYYEKAKAIYELHLDPNDYRMAAFYNNVSAAYKDLGDYAQAEAACYKAISVLESKGGYLGEIAVTQINIAHIYYEQDPFDERIYEVMDSAWELLKSPKNTPDGNFAFICSKCYPSFEFFGYFERGAELKALSERLYEGN